MIHLLGPENMPLCGTTYAYDDQVLGQTPHMHKVTCTKCLNAITSINSEFGMIMTAEALATTRMSHGDTGTIAILED